MKKTSLWLAMSASLVFGYAASVLHIPSSDAADGVACGDTDAKKKKGDDKEEDKS